MIISKYAEIAFDKKQQHTFMRKYTQLTSKSIPQLMVIYELKKKIKTTLNGERLNAFSLGLGTPVSLNIVLEVLASARHEK